MMDVVLRAENVSMHFGGLKAVQNVDMTIRKGDIFGIIGPNGAGKTTFFNVCSGLYRPTAGRVFLRGEDITGMSPEKIARKGMARTFQNIKLFNFMSVLDNVKVGFHSKTGTTLAGAILRTATYRRDEAEIVEKGLKILDMVGLSQYRDVKAGNLPYGLQRRVEIARALALDPGILLLDEPVAGMNPNETQDMVRFIRTLKDLEYTVAVIEHDMKFVMNCCDKVLVLNFGEKISEGTPGEIKADENVHVAYFGKGIVAGEVVRRDA